VLKTYSEMMTFDTYLDRFKYLQLSGHIGLDTFGYDRYLNQMFYHDPTWRETRDRVIIRDSGCDLAIEGREIHSGLMIHHIMPITKEDVLNRAPICFDMDNLVCVSHITHNAIHYGDESSVIKDPVERKANDTCPWRV
jgi:hypothetical protein